jgi:hypothetical protein
LTLDSLGIASIGLGATPRSRVVASAGNTVLQTSSFTYQDGTTADVAAISFATDQMNTQFVLPDGFEYDPEVFLLPNLRGYGSLPDLWMAMTLDPELKEMVLIAYKSDNISYVKLLVSTAYSNSPRMQHPPTHSLWLSGTQAAYQKYPMLSQN